MIENGFPVGFKGCFLEIILFDVGLFYAFNHSGKGVFLSQPIFCPGVEAFRLTRKQRWTAYFASN